MSSIEWFIRYLKASDWKSVSEIYQQGLDSGNASFETKSPTWELWDSSHLKECRIILQVDDEIAGWAALSPVSSRCVYGGVAEVSVYIAEKFQGQKFGAKLLEKLISESEENGIWTLQAGVFPENKASIHILKKLGFRKVGYREKIGQMNAIWRDTILLERRSNIIGMD